MLELRINGHTADIKEESIIAVTKQYESVHNPLLYYADWSKTIKLPISANNNVIFSNFNRLDSTVTNLSINPLKKIPCMILNNQEKVLEGYCKLENANTIFSDECYEITIYSTFGLIMNELKLLTFNKNAVDVDQKYIIDSPLSNDLVINRNLVLQSFEAASHYINSSNVTDWIGFMPTYQGKYSDFASDKEQILSSGRIEDMSKERDEHYTREFRSYYQQPYIWVDKLWQVARDKINMITDYTMVLDGSWFSSSNPYYKDLIYSCPSLFNADSNFRVKSEIYNDKTNIVKFNRPSKSPSLDTHHYYHVTNFTSTGVMELFDSATGIFNKDSNFGSTKVSGRFRLALFASNKNPQDDGKHFCKIRKDNPFYVRVYAENATTGNRIYGASKTVLLYSCEHDVGENTFDEKIDLGIADISNLGFFSGSDRPMIANTGYYQPSDTQDSSSHYVYNHGWQIQFDFALNVNENVPYKVYIEVWNANNGDPFEYTGTFYNVTWDWLWIDDFNTSVGDHNDKGYSMYFDTINVSCVTTENLRTGSAVSLYRVFPKDVTLCDVLLNYSKMFGLVWDVNEEEKTVTVMTRNRFFEDYRIMDWSDRIDRSKEFKFAPLNFDKRYVEFNYEDGDCTRLENYQSTYQVGYGTKRLDTGYDFNSDTNELFEKLTPSVICQKRQFSCMTNTEYEDRPNFVGYNYMIYPNEHYVDNDNNGSNAGMSGAFYFRNGNMVPDSRLSYKDVNGWDVYFITDDTEHMIKTQEYCWNQCGESTVLGYSLPDISTISNKYNGLRYSVHFAAPRDYYFEAPEDATIKYVYDSFWRRYINERYCSQNKKLTAYVYLTIDEFKDIDFREFIKIDNILYHIDKIYDFNYNSESPVKMDLVQVLDMTAYTEGQHNMPYLYTDQTIYLTDQDQTFPIHTTYNDVYVYRTLPWVTISIDNTNHTMTIRANDTTDTVRFGWITITHRNNAWSYVDWSFLVLQYPSPNYRLDVDQNTVLFDEMGGTKTVTIDCHDTTNYAISVTGGSYWMSARIREYWQTVELEERRKLLHLDITANPIPWSISRATSITLSITAGDQTFTQVINVAQQGGTHHSTDIDDGIITGGGSGIEVFDYDGNHVDTLLSGKTYHFDDLFPEEIDVNSLEITGGGSVSIKGNSGMQTIEFIPQLSDGKEVGGGLITAKTLNGKVVSYPYNVQAEGYVPTPPEPPAPEPSMKDTYFYVEDISGSINTLTIKKSDSSAPTIEVFRSFDQENWRSMGTTSTTEITVIIPPNNRIYLKATADTWGKITDGGSYISIHSNAITFTGNHNVGGNILSLLYGDDFDRFTQLDTSYTGHFIDLFYQDETLVDASNLVLPTNVTDFCYSQMFYYCTRLTTPPTLPAITMATRCYESMFFGCTALTTAPALPATTLADYCYEFMFYNCTSLTTAPALPATTLASSCYSYMFSGCTGLTTTPVLPATTLVSSCYSYMFNYCTSLNTIITFANDISATSCTNGWVQNVAPTGTFYNNGTAVYRTGINGIPTGWTEQSVTPTPASRHIKIGSDENSMFRIELQGSAMEPKTTNFFEYDIVDGTVFTVTALPKEGFTLNRWIDQNNNVYTTPVVTLTMSSSLVDQNNLFSLKLESKVAKKTVSLTIDPNGGTVTFGDDPTEYASVVTKKTIEGSTIANVKIDPPGIKTFTAWTDGSKTNPRDFTVYQDTSVSVIYSGANESVITLDGSGLLGADDVLILSLDGTEMMKAGYGEINKIKVSNRYLNDNHYVLELVCKINDVKSEFDRFSIGGTDTPQGENPYTDSNFKLRADTYIKVSCIPTN